MTTAWWLCRISWQRVVSTLKFPAGGQAEFNFVADRTANPPLLGDARHCGKTHAGRPADHFQNARNRRDNLHGSDICGEVGRHG
jgi:hypothetical protein